VLRLVLQSRDANFVLLPREQAVPLDVYAEAEASVFLPSGEEGLSETARAVAVEGGEVQN
jgi:hypothetical protein